MIFASLLSHLGDITVVIWRFILFEFWIGTYYASRTGTNCFSKKIVKLLCVTFGSSLSLPKQLNAITKGCDTRASEFSAFVLIRISKFELMKWKQMCHQSQSLILKSVGDWWPKNLYWIILITTLYSGNSSFGSALEFGQAKVYRKWNWVWNWFFSVSLK